MFRKWTVEDVTDEMADAANQARLEYSLGEQYTRRELGILRQQMKVAIAEAMNAASEDG